MKTIKPSASILQNSIIDAGKKIELCGRKCYKSEDAITPDSAEKFIGKLIGLNHMSVIEHSSLTVFFTIDRGVSHELVRHRLASFSQESTRYCNYSNDKFDNEITVIEPFFFNEHTEDYKIWESCCRTAEVDYFRLLKLGRSPQEARSILPNSLKTEIAVTANLREWGHIFNLRCSKAAHPQMRQVMIPTLLACKELIPMIYDNVEYDTDFPEQHYAAIELINM